MLVTFVSEPRVSEELLKSLVMRWRSRLKSNETVLFLDQWINVCVHSFVKISYSKRLSRLKTKCWTFFNSVNERGPAQSDLHSLPLHQRASIKHSARINKGTQSPCSLAFERFISFRNPLNFSPHTKACMRKLDSKWRKWGIFIRKTTIRTIKEKR